MASLEEYRLVHLKKTDTLARLLEKFPDHPGWDYVDLSSNPNLPLEFVRKHPERKWSYSALTNNEGVTLADIDKYSDIPWELGYLYFNTNVSFHEAFQRCGSTEHLDLFPYIWCKVTIADVESHPEVKWDFDILAEILPIQDILATRDKYDWNFLAASCGNKSITIDLILENPDVKWDFEYLSRNYALSMGDVRAHLEFKWDVTSLVEKVDFRLEDFDLFDLQHLTVVGYREAFDILLAYRDHGILPTELKDQGTFRYVIQIHCAPPELIRHVLTLRDPRYTRTFQFPTPLENLMWSPSLFSSDQNVTFELLIKHPEHMDFEKLSANWFMYSESTIKRNYFRDKWLAEVKNSYDEFMAPLLGPDVLLVLNEYL